MEDGAAARTQARNGRKGTQTSGAGGEREGDAFPVGNVSLGGLVVERLIG